MGNKKIIPLKRKILLILFPVMVAVFAVVYFVTFTNTKKVIIGHIEAEAVNQTQSVDYHVLADLSKTLGIMDNVKQSVEGCETEEEIVDYIYSIADAYPDTIPTGIYCGLESGTYIDKMWTPDEDWVMKERPWYTEGLKADEITLGEMYLDADSGQNIISIYGNLKNEAGEVIGVISADVPMDSIVATVEGASVMEGAKLYGIDMTSGLVFGDQEVDGEKYVTDSSDSLDQQILSMIQSDQLDTMVNVEDTYLMVSNISGTNFYLVYETPYSALVASLKATKKASIFASFNGIVLLGVAVYVLIAISLKPVGKLRNMIMKMEHLDLTERTEIKSHDEIGQMAEALNSMASNLKAMIAEMKNSIASIDEKAEYNSATAGHLATSSQQQYGAVEELSYTMSELNRAIEVIAEGATDLANTVVDTGNTLERAEKTIGETKNEIDQGYDAMNHMSDTMDSITDLSAALKHAVNDVQNGVQGISDLVTVINDIASQTNLLSLNASIEAARAGDAGRGFAVVAEEIRNLSENVGNSVSQIRETTENIQKLVDVVLRKTDESVEAVRLGGDAVQQTEAIFGQIRTNMDNISEVMNSVNTAFGEVERVAGDMAASTEEQTASTTMVLSTSENIKDMSKQFNEDGNNINAQGQELKELSGNLESQIGMFRV